MGTKINDLGDLERPIRTLLQKRCVFRSPPQKKWMKIDPNCRRQKCRSIALVSAWRHKVYEDIRGGSPWARQTTVELSTKAILSFFDISSETSEMRPALLYRCAVHGLLFIDPKMCDLEWPWLTIFRVKFVFAPDWLSQTVRKIIAWKLMKIDTYCQRCKSSAGTLVSGNNYKACADILLFGRVL